jgi:MFS family permease
LSPFCAGSIPQRRSKERILLGVRKIEGSPVDQLFTRDLMTGTLLLWVTFFMSLIVYYLLTSWLPTLLKTAGQTQQASALIALMLPIGSTVGAFVIGFLMDRFGAHPVLAGSYTLAAASIVMLGLSTATPWILVLAVFGAGLGTGGSQIGINALSAGYYPTANRATGVSWANAVGRTGSLVGSMAGGYLLNIGWSLGTVFGSSFCLAPTRNGQNCVKTGFPDLAVRFRTLAYLVSCWEVAQYTTMAIFRSAPRCAGKVGFRSSPARKRRMVPWLS